MREFLASGSSRVNGERLVGRFRLPCQPERALAITVNVRPMEQDLDNPQVAFCSGRTLGLLGICVLKRIE